LSREKISLRNNSTASADKEKDSEECMAVTARELSAQTEVAAEFLEFFYPIHYKLGMALEDALRSGKLTRKQVAILWLIRSEGKGGHMRRKDIEQRISTWFEVSSSAITKALRAMARPPLGLVQVVEDPRSGREKQILLTAKGERFLTTMVGQGQDFLRRILDQLTDEEIRTGSHFLRRVSDVLDQERAERGISNGTRQ
jgi:DNA-binding MarR family transcriptional regulator